MTWKLKTQTVTKSYFSNYLKRSDECIRTAHEAHSRKDWNAATICAIHACVSASDAFCVYFLGKHHSGDNHLDAARLLRNINRQDEKLSTNAKRLINVLSIKNMAEYEERLIFKKEAERVLKNSHKFPEYIKDMLP